MARALDGFDEFLDRQRQRCRQKADRSVRRAAAAARRLLDEPDPPGVDTYTLHGLPGFTHGRAAQLAELDGDEAPQE